MRPSDGTRVRDAGFACVSSLFQARGKQVACRMDDRACLADRAEAVMGSLSGSHILLVEDEPLIGMIVQTCLEEQGASVLWSTTDRGAYEAIERDGRGLDLLITDINLREGTTGFDVARRARASNPAMRVIYLSGEVGSDLPFGVDGALFLTKPVSEQRLIEAVMGLTEPQAALLVARPQML